MLLKLHSLNLKLCSKQYKNICFAPDCGATAGWQHNYSTKTRQAGWANEQSMYSLMSMIPTRTSLSSSFISGSQMTKNSASHFLSNLTTSFLTSSVFPLHRFLFTLLLMAFTSPQECPSLTLSYVDQWHVL